MQKCCICIFRKGKRMKRKKSERTLEKQDWECWWLWGLAFNLTVCHFEGEAKTLVMAPGHIAKGSTRTLLLSIGWLQGASHHKHKHKHKHIHKTQAPFWLNDTHSDEGFPMWHLVLFSTLFIISLFTFTIIIILRPLHHQQQVLVTPYLLCSFMPTYPIQCKWNFFVYYIYIYIIIIFLPDICLILSCFLSLIMNI